MDVQFNPKTGMFEEKRRGGCLKKFFKILLWIFLIFLGIIIIANIGDALF